MDKDLKEEISSLDPEVRKKIEKLFHQATHDEKTGIYNYKFLDNLLNIEIEQTKRGDQKLSLIMVDIDDFKQTNDKYGHIKADALLKKLAQLLLKQIRKSDVVARFGGEEFLILLPETSLAKAKKLATRLRNSIKKDNFLSRHNITVSGGITQFRKKDTKRSFTNRVDKAMYEAKGKGKDMFISDSGLKRS